MSDIAIGSAVSVEFLFYNSNGLISPDDVSGHSYEFIPEDGDFADVAEDDFVPTESGIGIYNYTWAAQEGLFKLVVTGSFDDSSPDIVVEKYFLVGPYASDMVLPLSESYVATFLGELSPLYLDPYEILVYYPEGDLIEITEIIWSKSLQLENIVGETNLTDLTALQYDWLVAATMCELSRRYGLTNSGLNGFTSASSFQLGDLQVDRGGSKSFSSGQYDLGNASSWCELAASLKDLLSGAGDTYKPVVPGANFCSEVPSRRLKCW